MNAKVIREACIGCGLCAAICPDIFKMDDEGIAVAAAMELSNENSSDAMDTAKQCPVEAIKVE